MKEKALICFSLAISIAAFGYAGWIHQHTERLLDQAIQNRERQLVQKLAPSVRELYKGLGVTNVVVNPATLDDLFGPYINVLDKMVNAPADEETNSASTNSDKMIRK